MSKSKTQEKLEQWGGHFFLLGICLTLLIGPLSVVVYLVREFSKIKIGQWKIGQWAPGKPFWIVEDMTKRGFYASFTEASAELNGSSKWGQPQKVTQMSRVEDMRRDLIFQFAGYVVAEIAREVFLFVY